MSYPQGCGASSCDGYGRRMNELEERITARLVRAIEQMRRDGAEVLSGQLALVDEDGVPRLSLADVARLVALEARRS